MTGFSIPIGIPVQLSGSDYACSEESDRILLVKSEPQRARCAETSDDKVHKASADLESGEDTGHSVERQLRSRTGAFDVDDDTAMHGTTRLP